MRSSLSGAVAALACVSLSTAQSWKTIPTVEAYGQHYFYTNNGSQFFIKGVAYQQNYAPNGASASSTSYSDPLSDSSACARDIPYMSRIFTNTIRVYAIDPTKNHDACMAALASAGIYVFADLSEPSTSIQTDNPTWNVPLYQRYTSVVDSLAKYQNVIGFFAGNEVVNRANESTAAAFVKAAVRDTKAYIKTKGYRTGLGVGYATSDVPTRDQLASYFACGDSSTHIDFWGYNVYSWCGQSSIQESSYDTRAKYFANYPVPVFFAEYGCNQFDGSPYSRPFTEVAALFGSQLTPVFSGGIVFEYFNSESNKYGLVEVSGASVSPYPDYTSLSAQLAKVTPSSTQKSAYTPGTNTLACPTVGASWSAIASPLPSPVNAQLCDCEAASYVCNVASDDQTKYGDIFNYICSNDANACVGFTHNATTGAYGAISGCSPKVQLGWAMNRYFLDQNSNPSACAFSGLATTQAAATAASCTSLLKAAGTNGQGSVPSPTGGSSGGSGSGGSGAATSSGLAGLAAGTPYTASEFGAFYMVAYSALALVSGLGMICL